MSQPRVLLAIDCATVPASVACLSDDAVEAELVHDGSQRADAWVGTAVTECLAAAGRSPADLRGLAVSIGPGTFTGIRVGIATALGLAAPSALPVAGVTTLEALADIGLQRAGRVVACIDARRDQVYAAIYEQPSRGDTATLTPSWGPAVCAPAEVTAALADDAAGATLALGSGAPLLAARNLEIDGAPIPLAAAIGRLAMRGWPPAGAEPIDWRPPEPLYLRPPDTRPPHNPLLSAPN